MSITSIYFIFMYNFNQIWNNICRVPTCPWFLEKPWDLTTDLISAWKPLKNNVCPLICPHALEKKINKNSDWFFSIWLVLHFFKTNLGFLLWPFEKNLIVLNLIIQTGSPSIQLKKLQPESVEWARLEDCKSMTISSFIDGLNLQENQPVTDKTYLFDQSIPIHFPRLAEEIVIPKYFASRYLNIIVVL